MSPGIRTSCVNEQQVQRLHRARAELSEEGARKLVSSYGNFLGAISHYWCGDIGSLYPEYAPRGSKNRRAIAASPWRIGMEIRMHRGALGCEPQEHLAELTTPCYSVGVLRCPPPAPSPSGRLQLASSDVVSTSDASEAGFGGDRAQRRARDSMRRCYRVRVCAAQARVEAANLSAVLVWLSM
jgi:hypothetical protein